MSNPRHSEISKELRARVFKYAPARTQRATWRVLALDSLGVDTLIGVRIDRAAVSGRVVDKLDLPGGSAIVLAAARTQFLAVDAALLPADFLSSVQVGDSVSIEPYARRRFSGERCDTPDCKDGVSRVTLGDSDPRFPRAGDLRCPELRDLVDQLGRMPAPDGFRRLAHILIDAGARDVSYVDPLPKQIIATPPEVACAVKTGRFCGVVAIVYDRGLDMYEIHLRDASGALVTRRSPIVAYEIGETLVDLIDDGAWRMARCEITKRARRRAVARAA